MDILPILLTRYYNICSLLVLSFIQLFVIMKTHKLKNSFFLFSFHFIFIIFIYQSLSFHKTSFHNIKYKSLSYNIHFIMHTIIIDMHKKKLSNKGYCIHISQSINNTLICKNMAILHLQLSPWHRTPSTQLLNHNTTSCQT